VHAHDPGGIGKVAKLVGLGVGTVHKLAREMRAG
jgi:hypothetical protein